MSVFLFQISDIYQTTSLGLVLIPGLINKTVPIGTPITIVRPDSSEIETIITSIFFDSSQAFTVEKTLKKEDVPIGSEIWAKRTITYDLSLYTLLNKNAIGTNYEIIFEHINVKKFFLKLMLSQVAGIRDNTKPADSLNRLRIDMISGSYASDLAIQMKNIEVKKFPEALIFLDRDCTNFCFRGVAEKIDLLSFQE